MNNLFLKENLNIVANAFRDYLRSANPQFRDEVLTEFICFIRDVGIDPPGVEVGQEVGQEVDRTLPFRRLGGG